jgi:hypothetical protein
VSIDSLGKKSIICGEIEMNLSMGACRKQRSKFLSIFFWSLVLECWELGKMKILKKILRILIIAGVEILIKKFWVKENIRGAYTFTKRGLQTDMAFYTKTKMPFPSPVQNISPALSPLAGRSPSLSLSGRISDRIRSETHAWPAWV